MAKIAIVVGNPMTDSYSEALGEAYRRGAESGGHDTKLFVLAEMNFDAIAWRLSPASAARARSRGSARSAFCLRPPGLHLSALVRRHAGDHERLHRARTAAGPA